MSSSIQASGDAIQPVTPPTAASPNEAHSGNRSFAKLLTDAEAVQDLVTLRYAHTPQSGPITGWLHGAMPLWLLKRMQLGR